MIISTINGNVLLFEELLKLVEKELYYEVQKNSKNFLSKKFKSEHMEDLVFNIIEKKSEGTLFFKTFRRVNSQEFPDIVSERTGFGLEIKQTKSNKWSSIGSSIMEGTRINNIDHIYLFFAKLSTDIGFKWKKYEECLEDVKITHSPRYFVNMELSSNETIFDKIGVSYSDLRKHDNPFDPIKEYYKKIRPNETTWYISSDENDDTHLDPIIKVWLEIDKYEKEKILSEIFIFFPEIFSSSNKKFSRPTSWLVSKYGIVIPNIRDQFTASGQKNVYLYQNKNVLVPRIIEKFLSLNHKILYSIKNIDILELSEVWGSNLISNTKYKKILNIWKNKINKNMQILSKNYKFDVKKMLEHHFKYEN